MCLCSSWPGLSLPRSHISETSAKSVPCPKAGDIPTSSGPGLPGPPPQARAATVDPDEPGHDDKGRAFLQPPPDPDAHGGTPGHDGEENDSGATPTFRIAPITRHTSIAG